MALLEYLCRITIAASRLALERLCPSLLRALPSHGTSRLSTAKFCVGTGPRVVVQLACCLPFMLLLLFVHTIKFGVQRLHDDQNDNEAYLTANLSVKHQSGPDRSPVKRSTLVGQLAQEKRGRSSAKRPAQDSLISKVGRIAAATLQPSGKTDSMQLLMALEELDVLRSEAQAKQQQELQDLLSRRAREDNEFEAKREDARRAIDQTQVRLWQQLKAQLLAEASPRISKPGAM